MKVTLITVSITTDSSGDYTSDQVQVEGKLLQYRYVPDGTSPLDTGADLTIAGNKTGFSYVNQLNIGTTAFQKSPRVATHADDGTALLYASAGEPVDDYGYVGGEQLTVTIANGGNTKLGKLYMWVGE